MHKIKCLVVDDEPVAQRIIISYLEELTDFSIESCCNNAIEARAVLLHKSIDLMFLDLEMPRLNGFDFLNIAQPCPPVIITTAYREFALTSYEFGVVDYLLKPISFDRFLKAIHRYHLLHHTASNHEANEGQFEFLYVKSNRQTLKLRKSDIRFVEGMNNYVKIHTSNTHVVYTSLGKLARQLGPSFVQVHKSFIVNKEKVDTFSKEQISLEGHIIPIGGTYKHCIREL